MSRRLAGRVVIATHNAGKLREMRELLAPFGLAIVAAAELGLPEPEETGATFAANAALKALAAAAAAGLPAIADDSGLAVEALGGEPGVHSARWAGPNKDFAAAMARIERLLQEKGAREPAGRRAAFIADLCIAWPDGETRHVEGRIDGALVWPPRGAGGFGYDPMFLPDDRAKTFGEMTSAEKHGTVDGAPPLSHRARAFVALAASGLLGAPADGS